MFIGVPLGRRRGKSDGIGTISKVYEATWGACGQIRSHLGHTVEMTLNPPKRSVTGLIVAGVGAPFLFPG